jgi:AraC-like DNA-binding protein
MKKKLAAEIQVIRQVFNDLEQLNSAAVKWRLDFRQLDAGKLEGEVMLLDSAKVQLATVNFNRQLEQRGYTPKGYRTFAIPADYRQFFKWRDFKIKGNHLMLFPESGEIDAINYPGFKVFTFSLHEDLIRIFITQERMPLYVPRSPEVLELSSPNMTNLRQATSYLFKKASQQPDIVGKLVFKRLMFYDVPSVLLSSIQTPVSKPKTKKSRIRDIALQKATAFLSTCTTDYPTVYELCLIAGASQRTLEYAFKDKFGLTPQAYMKKQRLNRIHHALIKADPAKNNVMEIAHKSGIRHLGQFAADYKKMFGISPSITLQAVEKGSHYRF